MKLTPSVAAAFLALTASAALAISIGTDEQEPRRIAPGSHWWITDATCKITGYWGSPEAEITSMSIEPMGDDGYRLDITNNRWRDVPVGTVIQATFGFDGGTTFTGGDDIRGGDASGFSLGNDGQLFSTWVTPALIDGLKTHRELDVYRDGNLLINIGLGRAADAIAAMNTCHGAMEESDRLANLAMYGEPSTDEPDMLMNASAADMGAAMDDAAFDAAMNQAEAASANEQPPPKG